VEKLKDSQFTLFRQIFECLNKLTGLHRQLLDVVRLERLALVEANVKLIQERTLSKQAQIEGIRNTELERLKLTGQLAMSLKKPLTDLTLPKIIILIQGEDLKFAEQFRTTYNVLTVLIQRITEQNNENRSLVEKSLEHVQQMKRNLLGESTPKSNTYNPQGQKAGGIGGARLFSKEA
jgi:flagellar biosynthesis/type III secretory pathway chaperone